MNPAMPAGNSINPNLTELQFLEEGPVSGRGVPVQRPTVIENRYVNQARARYAKVANAVPGGYSGRLGNDREATESISKWSQWLKGGAPAPVC